MTSVITRHLCQVHKGKVKEEMIEDEEDERKTLDVQKKQSGTGRSSGVPLEILRGRLQEAELDTLHNGQDEVRGNEFSCKRNPYLNLTGREILA